MEFAHQKTVSGEEIRQLRKKLDFTQKNFAAFANVSVKTVQHWESGKKEVSGPIVALLKILKEHPQLKDELMIPAKKYPLPKTCKYAGEPVIQFVYEIRR